jgi:hypothetical protein
MSPVHPERPDASNAIQTIRRVHGGQAVLAAAFSDTRRLCEPEDVHRRIRPAITISAMQR